MPELSTVFRNNVVGLIQDNFSYMRVYSGAIPANGDASPSGTLLVSWTGTITWGTPSAGSVALTSTPITSDTAVATGTAGYAELWDGGTDVIYCTVGTTGADINLSSLSVTSGGTVSIANGTVTMPGT